MKNINKLLVFFLVSLIPFASCKKALDINKDPNNPSLEQGSAKLVFPAAVASSAGRIGGSLAILGGIWSQYYTQNTTSNQYKTIDAFQLSKSDFGGEWTELYAGALNDLKYVMDDAKAKGNWNYYLMGAVIKAYTMQVIVDLYDQAPYSEAFQGSSNLQPKFDQGFDIYKGLLAEIDEALSKDFTLSSNVIAGNTDFIFPADDDSWTIDNWIRFANTLKLKMYLRMSIAKPTEAQAGIADMVSSGAEFLDTDAQMNVFIDQPDKSNPLYEYNFRKLNTDGNLRASVTFLSWLELNADPRLPFYFNFRTGSTTAYLGINQGDYLNANPVFGTASKPNISATDPVDFFSLAEVNFLEAEALLRYAGGAGAKEKYDAGVTASFARYGLDASSFLAPTGAYAYPSAGTVEQQLEAIITQKWASMPGSHSLEAFFEKNRTGYPKTSTVYSTDAAYIPGQFVYPFNGVTNGQFAKRLVFPDAERSKNSSTPAEVPLTTPVWWDAN
ncbi:MAG TPA: SusD/RagB family nutrient-binding outer membrane lipoprotein [Ferruginibacter sp.]|nr:SusD/RagB family nutrient-binding outer membrane lipoprotein [Ferruginibacter sp.]HPH92339.1 SusD/RagB family nutrient-binding outer membrane lipoprotein [Ferruginibacter sp.]